jgi:hypothetical protein
MIYKFKLFYRRNQIKIDEILWRLLKTFTDVPAILVKIRPWNRRAHSPPPPPPPAAAATPTATRR